MTLKEETLHDVMTYLKDRKNQLILDREELIRPTEITDAMIVELLFVERLILKKFAEYNTKLMQEIKKASEPNEPPEGY